MKTKFFLITFLFLVFGIKGEVLNRKIDVVKYISISYEGSNSQFEDSDPFYRIPTTPIPCTLDSKKGIELHGEGEVSFISYEVWVSHSSCIATFDSEEEFLKFLFALKGVYEIRLFTGDCAYIGHLYI